MHHLAIEGSYNTSGEVELVGEVDDLSALGEILSGIECATSVELQSKPDSPEAHLTQLEILDSLDHDTIALELRPPSLRISGNRAGMSKLASNFAVFSELKCREDWGSVAPHIHIDIAWHDLVHKADCWLVVEAKRPDS